MKAESDTQAVSLRCALLTISDRERPEGDTSGDLLAERLRADGHLCVDRARSPANLYAIRRQLSLWIADDGVQVVLCNGGTGYGRGKVTVAAVQPLLDRAVPGFGELFRQLSYQDIGSAALQSDALAGLANDTLIFCLPGAPDACALAWDRLLREQLDSRHRPCNFASAYRPRRSADT